MCLCESLSDNDRSVSAAGNACEINAGKEDLPLFEVLWSTGVQYSTTCPEISCDTGSRGSFRIQKWEAARAAGR